MRMCSSVSAPNSSYFSRSLGSRVIEMAVRYRCSPHCSCIRNELSRSAMNGPLRPVPSRNAPSCSGAMAASGGLNEAFVTSGARPPVSLVVSVAISFSLLSAARGRGFPEVGDGVLAFGLEPVLPALRLAVQFDDLLRRGATGVDPLLVVEVPVVGRQLTHGDVIRAVRPQVDLLGQDPADVVLVRLELHPEGKRRGKDLLRVLALELAQQAAGLLQLLDLHVEMQLPQLTQAPVLGLVLHERVVHVDLVVLVEDEVLEEALQRVEQRLILRDVLLLDHGDLEVQTPGDRLHE